MQTSTQSVWRKVTKKKVKELTNRPNFETFRMFGVYTLKYSLIRSQNIQTRIEFKMDNI